MHIDRGGQQFGPYNLDEVNEYLSSGVLLPTDNAWAEGQSEWMPISWFQGVIMPDLTPAQSSSLANQDENSMIARGGNRAAFIGIVIGAVILLILVILAVLMATGVVGGVPVAEPIIRKLQTNLFANFALITLLSDKTVQLEITDDYGGHGWKSSYYCTPGRAVQASRLRTGV